MALVITITPHPTNTRHLSAASQVRSLRHGIAWHRARTWHWQDVAGREHTYTSHAERHTKSTAYLAWIDHLWSHRRIQARRYALAHPRVESLRSFAGCLAPLIDIEDPAWDPRRWNAGGSGAYGLPQALPGSKMRSAGADWATNPRTQIRWMRGYVAGRYGGCVGAMSHEHAYGWY